MVFHEVYEVVGLAKKRAAVFAQVRNEAYKAQWKFVKSYGAAGFRPGYGGCIRSLIFNEKKSIPGLRYVGHDGKRYEYEPHRGSKVGKGFAATLNEAPRVAPWGEFANTFGWRGRSPIDTEGGRGVIYHCIGIHVVRPRDRFFMKYPRELKDGWKAPAGLKLVRESEMLRAIEDHNATVKR